MDYVNFVSERIAKLRTAKDVSARDMSISIGQNVNYINSIENRKAEPSLSGFFFILEYFDVAPHDFFDMGNQHPALINELISNAKQLDENELLHLSSFIKEIIAKRK